MCFELLRRWCDNGTESSEYGDDMNNRRKKDVNNHNRIYVPNSFERTPEKDLGSNGI